MKKTTASILAWLVSALCLSLALAADTSPTPKVSDDEIYIVVKKCMDLQYSVRSDWLPSDTTKAANCIVNATKSYGEERVKKMIGGWLNRPFTIDCMTIFTESQRQMIREAFSKGMTKEDINLSNLVIIAAREEIFKSGK
jgi:hypothetical protein